MLATRGSALALRQATIVADRLRISEPHLDVHISTVRTTGDRDSRPFAAIGGKGLFIAEVEREVAEGRADIAVHSAKDLTSALAPGCVIACVPARAQAHDVIVGGSGASGEERLSGLAPGAVVGTSSMRRRALLAEARPDVEAAELRGNVDTRMHKIEAGEVDAGILAGAGLERLGVDATAAPLNPEWWVPAPGQGALAVEARADDEELLALLACVDDPDARAALTCERAFAASLEGGCSVPLGCLASSSNGTLTVTGFLGMPDGSHSLRDRISGPYSAAESLGRELADALRQGGGDEILESLAESDAPALGAP